MAPTVPVHEKAAWSIADLAALGHGDPTTLRRSLTTPAGEPVTRQYRGLEARLHLPGGVTVPAYRRACRAGWIVYAAPLRRALDQLSSSAGQPHAASPSPGLAGNPTAPAAGAAALTTRPSGRPDTPKIPDLAGTQVQHETPAELAGTSPGSHQRKDIP